MHFGDSIFIFLLALVLFGPKKLPEIGRQIGKLLGEFRRASNEFKYQIQEELRNMEDEERRKKLAEEQAAKNAQAAVETPPISLSETPAAPSIMPPSTGTPVATDRPYAMPIEPEPLTAANASASPAASEVIVDPPAPTPADITPEPPVAPAASAHIDLTIPTNGTHPSTQESTVDAGTTGERISVTGANAPTPGEPVSVTGVNPGVPGEPARWGGGHG